ncbi:MAG: diaminopimelate epimerase [Thermodesulfobacteriota bacterium]|nr:diaminopimelate epimerase [Thermodesulfobacteriota bacterium]
MMNHIDFFKMSGSGNDFIIIDNRDEVINGDSINDVVKKVCRRKTSVGADGLILIHESDRADFQWKFFNADGSEAEMCGNGSRCAARFAYLKGISPRELSFETLAGIIKARILEDTVELEMTIPKDIHLDQTLIIEGEKHQVNFIDTGVPHVVKFVKDTEACQVVELGKKIRYHHQYTPAGTNVNFTSVIDKTNMTVRTYERGVEDETLACGTGAVASALVAYLKGMVFSPVAIKTKGGEVLTVHFIPNEVGFEEVFLEGDARVIYEGRLWDDALIG